MRAQTLLWPLALSLLLLPAPSLFGAGREKDPVAKDEGIPVLTEAQLKAGWQLLFDGKTPTGWRGYRRSDFPEGGWVVEKGALHVVAHKGMGDILFAQPFGDFHLILDWKASKGANSGIMYRVSEDENAPWKTGPEYQILDDGGAGAAPTSVHAAGAIYALYAPCDRKKLNPAGAWNRAEIKLRRGHLEHWLNGVLVAETKLGSEEWIARVKKSKFAVFPKFGRNSSGFIDLQDHGYDVWFRNIRLRDLSLPAGKKEIPLFNGKDLSGWTCHLEGGAPMEGTWSVKNGILVCKGTPTGYLQTERSYKDFILRLQWRFAPGKEKGGNSGVLLRKVGPDKVWPRCVEAQLKSGDAGDFWVMDGYPLKAAPERTEERHVKKTHDNERAPGEWNEYEIIVKGDKITLLVNGEVVNEAWDVEAQAGKIGLQSEGTEIHFREICIVPLDG